METGRVPAHLEISGMIRSCGQQGGFGTVLAKGERDAGTILVICCEKGTNCRLYERMPQLDGTRKWTLTRKQDTENKIEFSDYWQRRKRQDPDIWIVELDAENPEQFIAMDQYVG
ncbi:DUF1491 family protein [Altericroceibacterium endophyticum]|uniref:DUF1491 family protein n=1 Tax=Altericroceibacterium endophyticum TaxID=1808508 RepID=A0A6I4T688_9SPHN|nr:DUF1491 family protein [Altericroceibacterium endophyticum]MXO65641.1 DUF1491 family protein [Altericroceibacterium endophyticum]